MNHASQTRCEVASGLQYPALDLLQRAFENLSRCPVHHHRRRSCFGVTLVAWNENAQEECFGGGAAID